MNRRGDWMQTRYGRFWPLDPRPEDVDIRDIAHHLSQICRFGGACVEPYYVAQHAVLVSIEVEMRLRRMRGPSNGDKLLALVALHHEDAEAYIGDMVRPLKLSMDDFRRVEEEILRKAIAPYLKVNPDLFESFTLREVDNALLATEARDLMGDPDWASRTPRLDMKIVPMSPQEARLAFLRRHCTLTGTSIKDIKL